MHSIRLKNSIYIYIYIYMNKDIVTPPKKGLKKYDYNIDMDMEKDISQETL